MLLSAIFSFLSSLWYAIRCSTFRGITTQFNFWFFFFWEARLLLLPHKYFIFLHAYEKTSPLVSSSIAMWQNTHQLIYHGFYSFVKLKINIKLDDVVCFHSYWLCASYEDYCQSEFSLWTVFQNVSLELQRHAVRV